ncbi:MAG: IS1634 family transposase [Acidobacteria bacterium]|nr:IS1634 family transposase [Acidobacteriota bacterium]MBU1475276.1 IS1634 family transposase [Acidobacteriota bacterium]MBU2438635.1 IS1634 family transposase [Acidobacteriota bacterium]
MRVKRSVQKGVTYEYLQIAESYRINGKPRQRVLATLGRRDQLQTFTNVDSLIQSLGNFSEKFRVVESVRSQNLAARSSKAWGPALVFQRLWEEQGLPEILQALAKDRKFGFDIDRVAFAMALQRLCAPGSDLQGSGWLKTVEAPGFSDIALQHLYRTNAFLAEVREELEKVLFARDRDLFSQTLDLVFLDTTSVYVYRSEETEWRRRGFSRDRRADLPQLVLAVAVDRKGWPVSWEVFPGNTADPVAFKAMVMKMRQRFRIGRIVVVADRGMMSEKSVDLLTSSDPPYDYILGCRMRKQKAVGEEVLSRAGRYQDVAVNLKVKEVRVGDDRYIVCLNEEEARKDAAAREEILERLREKLSRGEAKSLLGNRGYARYLKMSKEAVRINDAAVNAEARYDGKFVLRTNTELEAAEVAQTYKSLWRVERIFRETKSTLEFHPIFHQTDETSIGHIVAGFLALRLEVDLQRRMEEKKIDVSWLTLMRDLAQVQAVRVELDGKTYILRTDLQGVAHQGFLAAGVRPPSPVTLIK